MTGISCPAANACTAVGATGALDPSGMTPFNAFAEHWNGRHWTIQHVPRPRAGGATLLNSVSCTSPQSCTAVGAWSPSRTDGARFNAGAYFFTKTRVLIEHWTTKR